MEKIKGIGFMAGIATLATLALKKSDIKFSKNPKHDDLIEYWIKDLKKSLVVPFILKKLKKSSAITNDFLNSKDHTRSSVYSAIRMLRVAEFISESEIVSEKRKGAILYTITPLGEKLYDALIEELKEFSEKD